MFKVLTIDADYWYPLDQEGHCGHCDEYRQITKLRRRATINDVDKTDLVTRYLLGDTISENRTIPTKEEVADLIRPGTPIRVTESHAAMFGILRRLSARHKDLRVTNIDEHSDLEPYVKQYTAISCANWVGAATQYGYLKRYSWIGSEKMYQQWRPQIKHLPSLVHICRSSPYMSTRGDRHFVELVLSIEKAAGQRAVFFFYCPTG